MLAGLYEPAGRVSVLLSAGIQMVRKYRNPNVGRQIHVKMHGAVKIITIVCPWLV